MMNRRHLGGSGSDTILFILCYFYTVARLLKIIVSACTLRLQRMDLLWRVFKFGAGTNTNILEDDSGF